MSGFTSVKKQTQNRYLNMYHMEALDSNQKNFDYYFASRKEREDLVCDKTQKNLKPDGVLIYAILKDDPEKIVMIKQYRYPLGRKIMELPAGLIDGEEDALSAAIRELKEETGFVLEPFLEGNPVFSKPFFSAQGLTDECCSTVFGYAVGESSENHQEETEDIQVMVLDKKQIKELLKTEQFSMRSAYLLMNFLQSDPANPFSFLQI